MNWMERGGSGRKKTLKELNFNLKIQKQTALSLVPTSTIKTVY